MHAVTKAYVEVPHEISNFKTFLESWFSVRGRGTGNFTAAVIITQYHGNIKAQQNTCNQGYFPKKKKCKLRNLTFYNFSQNLGFQSLEKNLTTLQLLRILHGICIISKFVRRTTAKTIFRKSSILQNFAFYNFSQNLWYSILRRRILHSISTISKLHKKHPASALFKNMCNL